jgi:hypothetical protein
MFWQKKKLIHFFDLLLTDLLTVTSLLEHKETP